MLNFIFALLTMLNVTAYNYNYDCTVVVNSISTQETQPSCLRTVQPINYKGLKMSNKHQEESTSKMTVSPETGIDNLKLDFSLTIKLLNTGAKTVGELKSMVDVKNFTDEELREIAIAVGFALNGEEPVQQECKDRVEIVKPETEEEEIAKKVDKNNKAKERTAELKAIKEAEDESARIRKENQDAAKQELNNEANEVRNAKEESIKDLIVDTTELDGYPNQTPLTVELRTKIEVLHPELVFYKKQIESGKINKKGERVLLWRPAKEGEKSAVRFSKAPKTKGELTKYIKDRKQQLLMRDELKHTSEEEVVAVEALRIIEEKRAKKEKVNDLLVEEHYKTLEARGKEDGNIAKEKLAMRKRAKKQKLTKEELEKLELEGKSQIDKMKKTWVKSYEETVEQDSFTNKDGIVCQRIQYHLYLPMLNDCIDIMVPMALDVLEHFKYEGVKSLQEVQSSLTTLIYPLKDTLQGYKWNITTIQADKQDAKDRHARLHYEEMNCMAAHLIFLAVHTLTAYGEKLVDPEALQKWLIHSTTTDIGEGLVRTSQSIDFGTDPLRGNRRVKLGKGLIYSSKGGYDKLDMPQKWLDIAGKGGNKHLLVKDEKKVTYYTNDKGEKVRKLTANEKVTLVYQQEKSAVNYHRDFILLTPTEIYELLLTMPDVLGAISDVKWGSTVKEHTDKVKERTLVMSREIWELVHVGESVTFKYRRDLTGRMHLLAARHSILNPHSQGKPYYENVEATYIHAKGLKRLKQTICTLNTGGRKNAIQYAKIFDEDPQGWIEAFLTEPIITEPDLPDIAKLTADNITKALQIAKTESKEAMKEFQITAKEIETAMKEKITLLQNEYQTAKGSGAFKEMFYRKSVVEAYYRTVAGLPTTFLAMFDNTTGGMGYFAAEAGDIKLATLANILDGRKINGYTLSEPKVDSEGRLLEGEVLTPEEATAYNAYVLFAEALGFKRKDGSTSYKEAKLILMPMLHGAGAKSAVGKLVEAGVGEGRSEDELTVFITARLVLVFGIGFLNISKMNAWAAKHLITPTCTTLEWTNRVGQKCYSQAYEEAVKSVAVAYAFDSEPKASGKYIRKMQVTYVRAMPLEFQRNAKGQMKPFSKNEKAVFKVYGTVANIQHSCDPDQPLRMMQDPLCKLKIQIFDNFIGDMLTQDRVVKHSKETFAWMYIASPIWTSLMEAHTNSGIHIPKSQMLIRTNDEELARSSALHLYYPKLANTEYDVEGNALPAKLCPIKKANWMDRLYKAETHLQP